MGSAWQPEADNAGVIPSVMDELFTRMELAQHTDFTVKVSFVEIHKARDRLQRGCSTCGCCTRRPLACLGLPEGPCAGLARTTRHHVPACLWCLVCACMCATTGGGARPAVDRHVRAAPAGEHPRAADGRQPGRRRGASRAQPRGDEPRSDAGHAHARGGSNQHEQQVHTRAVAVSPGARGGGGRGGKACWACAAC
jgi:hypothetical protein